MYHIAICDDEEPMRRKIRSYVEKCAADLHADIHITEFPSADKLLLDYPKELDLLLLDIYMGGVDGMNAAKEIRSFDPEVCIIFITNMYQRAIDGYAVRAFGFIRKPLNQAEIHHEISCALQQIDRNKEQEHVILLKNGRTSYRVPISQISYCEVRNHEIIICRNGEEASYRCTMSSIEEQLLPFGFVRCHASYLVNIRHIKEVGTDDVLLKDGNRIPISKRKRREFMTALTEYIGSQV